MIWVGTFSNVITINMLVTPLYWLIYFKLGWICSRSSKERINCGRSSRQRYCCFGCREKSDSEITRRKNSPKNMCFGWPCYDGLCRFNCWRSNYYEKSKVKIWESTDFLSWNQRLYYIKHLLLLYDAIPFLGKNANHTN